MIITKTNYGIAPLSKHYSQDRYEILPLPCHRVAVVWDTINHEIAEVADLATYPNLTIPRFNWEELACEDEYLHVFDSEYQKMLQATYIDTHSDGTVEWATEHNNSTIAYMVEHNKNAEHCNTIYYFRHVSFGIDAEDIHKLEVSRWTHTHTNTTKTKPNQTKPDQNPT